MGCFSSRQHVPPNFTNGGPRPSVARKSIKGLLSSKASKDILDHTFRNWWPADHVEKISNHFIALSYPKNTTLSTQGTQGCYYIVMSGEVDILLDGSTLCCKRSGDAFHLGTMVSKTMPKMKRRIIAQVSEECQLLALTAPAFQQFVTLYPDLKSDAIALLGADPVALFEGFDMVRSFDDGIILGYIMALRSLRQGAMLFDEDSLGRSLYVVVRGQCAAVSAAALEKTAMLFTDATDTLRLFGPGEFFGEIALSFAIPRTTAIYSTMDKTLCLELDKSAYEKFCLLVGSANIQRVQARIQQSTAEQFQKYKCPFFDAIPPKTFPELAKLCRIDIHQPNTVIFHQGDIADSFYMIVHGNCAVIVNTKDGVNRQICTMGRGKYFGEIALVKDATRTATVTTTERCVIMSVKKDNFREFMDAIPEAAADFKIKLARYEVDLQSVLSHSKGVELFTKHLEREFSHENIMFWKACRAYRNINDDWKEHLPHRGSAVLMKPNVQDVKVRMPHVIDVDMEAFESFEPYQMAIAKKIYDTFVSETAEYQVNVSSIVRQALEHRMESAGLDEKSYAEAEQAIVSLMNKDSFSRFKQSDLFQELLGEAYPRFEEQERVLRESKKMQSEGNLLDSKKTGKPHKASKSGVIQEEPTEISSAHGSVWLV
jgi:CRP-like cAMP-binding protein